MLNTGVHGANRLASNSLLEGLVFGNRITIKISEKLIRHPMTKIKNIDISYHILQKTFEKINTIKIKKELQDLMWNKVGITRTYKGLVEAQKKIAQWKFYLNREFTEIDQIELVNLVTLADLVTRSALTRKESRGAHYRQDFPNRDDVNWKRYIEY